jgi:hypothetical protein
MTCIPSISPGLIDAYDGRHQRRVFDHWLRREPVARIGHRDFNKQASGVRAVESSRNPGGGVATDESLRGGGEIHALVQDVT